MDDPNVNDSNGPRRNKLGLALAGGGFRASLFHLGVLHRMAELDLLRSVEVLSTVSGGSIIGALYILLLKKRLDQKANLTRDEYRELIKDLDHILVTGIKKNLRTRLFMNPFGLLRVLITNDTLGRRMARIYERYIYRIVVDGLQPTSRWIRLLRPGRISLRDTMMRPGKGVVTGGIESYNRSAVVNKGSVVTCLILNATSLNSGAPFRFSSVEIGDSRLGFFRYDEIPQLQKRKKLLVKHSLSTLSGQLASPASGKMTIGDIPYDRGTVSLAYWWRMRKEQPGMNVAYPKEWDVLFKLDGFPGRMLDAEFGLLRQIKLAAWHLRIGMAMDPCIDGGLTPSEHKDMFWEGIEQIYEEQATNLEKDIKSNPALVDLLLDFVLELYYLRSAEVMSENIDSHWKKLRLGEAVGASASFPPVFPPYITHDFYDDWHVSRLGLTDGGVYDNVGLTTLFQERCNYIIASDTGGLFAATQQSSRGRIGMSGRIISIMMKDVAESQRAITRQRRSAAKRIEDLIRTKSAPANSLTNDDLLGLSFFHIESPEIDGPGLKLNLDRKLLASLRTDLDGFGDVEIASLVNHGYDTADRYLRQYLADSPYKDPQYWTPPKQGPKTIQRSNDDVKRILQVGESRFFRALKLYAPVSILFSVAVILATAWAKWETQASVQDAVNGIAKLSLGWIESVVSILGAGWTRYPVSIGVFVLVAAIAAVIIVTLKVKLTAWLNRLKNSYVPWFSKFSTVYKWARSLSQNVVWVFGLWPLAIIFGGAALAWIGHLFYYLPFECKTRNTKINMP